MGAEDRVKWFLLTLAACLPSVVAPDGYRHFVVDGVEFYVHPSGVNYTPARLSALLKAADLYWGGLGPWKGITVTILPASAYIDCYGAAIGCTSGAEVYVVMAEGHIGMRAGSCPEASPLFHELGHVRWGDPLHVSGLWRDPLEVPWESFTRTACPDAPSSGWRTVWRSEIGP